MTNPHRVDVYLTEEQFTELAGLASSRHVGIQALVVEAVDSFLDKCGKTALLNAILADDQMLVPDPEALRDELAQLRSSRFPDFDVR